MFNGVSNRECAWACFDRGVCVGCDRVVLVLVVMSLVLSGVQGIVIMSDLCWDRDQGSRG